MSKFADWWFGREPGADALVEERELEVTDIAVAFSSAQEAVTGSGTSLPTVYRCAQFTINSVASLHLDQVSQRTGLKDDQPPPLLSDPNPPESYNDWMTRAMTSLVYRGNAYFTPVLRDRVGNIITARVLDPDEVSVQWNRSRTQRIYSWRDRTLIEGETIFHCALNMKPWDVTGVGPVQAAADFLDGVAAQYRKLRTLAEDDATPSMLLKVAKNLTTKEAEEVRDIWEGTHRGRSRPAVTGLGVEAEPLSFSPHDAQFIEGLDFASRQIAVLFGMDAFFLNESSGGSMVYQNTEVLMRNFITTTLRPDYLEKLEATISRMLPRGKLARFDISEHLEADEKTQVETLTTAIASRLMTPNEARQRLGLPPIDGGDEIAPAQSPPSPASQNGSGPVKELVDA